MKYSNTVRPSRKFALMGSSMIRPDGSVISPRIPASWRICWMLPRAPDWAIMYSGLKGVNVLSMARVIASVASVQTSTVFRYRSSLVMRPRRYWVSIASTSLSALARISSFSLGITMSLSAIPLPLTVAKWNPRSLMLSSSCTVLVEPRRL